MSEHLRYPLAVHHVGLAARDRFDGLSVRKHHVKMLLEHAPDRLPINAGRLHSNMPDTKASEPLGQLTQVSRSTAKTAQMLLRSVLLLKQNTNRYRRIMHIASATA